MAGIGCGDAAISVFNSLGSLLYKTRSISGSEEMDLSALPKGVYVVQITGDKEVISKKLLLE